MDEKIKHCRPAHTTGHVRPFPAKHALRRALVASYNVAQTQKVQDPASKMDEPRAPARWAVQLLQAHLSLSLSLFLSQRMLVLRALGSDFMASWQYIRRGLRRGAASQALLSAVAVLLPGAGPFTVPGGSY